MSTFDIDDDHFTATCSYRLMQKLVEVLSFFCSLQLLRTGDFADAKDDFASSSPSCSFYFDGLFFVNGDLPIILTFLVFFGLCWKILKLMMTDCVRRSRCNENEGGGILGGKADSLARL